ncbi:MAG: rhomboid family intramembrane serine protease [Candidatus Hermodarchaeota archaeon]
MALLSNLLRSKNLDLPYGTILFVLNCLIVTIPLLFFPVHSLFAPNPAKNQFLQFLICQFGHGGPNLPTWYHLVPNLLGIIIIGFLVERSMGTTRYILLLASAYLAVIAYCILVNKYGLGSSGLLFSYWPFMIAILYQEWKERKRQAFKDLKFLFLLFLNIFAPISSIVTWTPLWSFTNIVHFIGILTGGLLLFIWRNPYFSNLDTISQGDKEEIIFDEFTSSHFYKKIAIIAFSTLLLCNIVIVGGIMLLYVL